MLHHHAERRILFIVMPNVIMLSVIMLSVIMLSVIMLSVIILSVVAPTANSNICGLGRILCQTPVVSS